MFKTKYRVVRDTYCGFQCQVRHWWFPVWLQMDFINTHLSLEHAKKYIEKRGGDVVAVYEPE